MTLPNFLVIGVAKSGTTALHRILGQHPDVFVSPRKEPRFFCPEPYFPMPADMDPAVPDRAEYEALFDRAIDEHARGESSTRYYHCPSAPDRVHDLIPGARFVAVLRQPVERARSHYQMVVGTTRAGYRPFEDYFREARTRVDTWLDEPWGGLGLASSLYADGLRRWQARFEPDRLQVHLHDDLQASPERVLSAIFAHLGVDPSFRPELTRHNVGRGPPRSPALLEMVMRPNRVKRASQAVIPRRLRRRAAKALVAAARPPTTPLDPALRREFTDVYRADIDATAGLLDRDLSHWLD